MKAAQRLLLEEKFITQMNHCEYDGIEIEYKASKDNNNKREFSNHSLSIEGDSLAIKSILDTVAPPLTGLLSFSLCLSLMWVDKRHKDIAPIDEPYSKS